TFIAADATASHIPREGYQLTPTKWWNSPESGGRYPVGWTISCPELSLSLSVETPMEKQELVLSPVTYWEGMIRVTGTRAGKPVKGTGYMELTGYAGPLVGLAQ